MFEYKLTVLGDGSTQRRVYTLQSPHALDKRLLQLVGMVCDEGMNPETIRQEVPTAESYVGVEGSDTEPASWIDDSLKGLI